MANEYKQILLDLQKNEAKGNKTCIDCNAFYPQWASVSHGIMFCLECSGVHRSLGVHLSFVRSLTMDKWSEDQIKRMQMGGNKKALEFFKSHPDWREGMTIQEKYDSEFARLYKEKLTADVEGRPWTMPTRSISQKLPKSTSNASMNNKNISSATSIGPKTDRERNEEFFASKGSENSARPDDLPPSQGGKYSGFGSGYQAPVKEENDPVELLSKGWSFFSSVVSEASKVAISSAETIGKKVNETVIEPTTRGVRDPNFSSNVTKGVAGYMGYFSEKVSTGLEMLAKEGNNLVTRVGNEINASTYNNQHEESQWASNQSHGNISSISEPKSVGKDDLESWSQPNTKPKTDDDFESWSQPNTKTNTDDDFESWSQSATDKNKTKTDDDFESWSQPANKITKDNVMNGVGGLNEWGEFSNGTQSVKDEPKAIKSRTASSTKLPAKPAAKPEEKKSTEGWNSANDDFDNW